MEPLGKQHTRLARQKLAEEGVEMTIEELEQTRGAAFEKMRQALRTRGYPVPEDDTEFFLLLKSLGL